MAKQNDKAILYTVRWLKERDPETAAKVADHLHHSLVGPARVVAHEDGEAVAKVAVPWMQTADVIAALGWPAVKDSSRRVTQVLLGMGWTNEVIRPKGEKPKRAWRPKGMAMAAYPTGAIPGRMG